MRKHYVTLYCLGDEPVEVTYIDRTDGKGIEVLFERAVDGGFDDFYIYLDGTIKSRIGYTDEEIAFFKKLIESSKNTIMKEAAEIV